ncbi:MAG: chloride channel protein [Bacteroidota bacterium]
MLIFRRINQSISWAQSQLSRKQFIFMSAILVGVSAGLAAVVLKWFVHAIFFAATYDKLGNFKYLYLVLPIIGIALTVYVNKRFLNGRLVKGLSQIHYAIANKLSFMPKRQMYDQIVTSSLTVGLGGSTGLEAPIVITGAAFGSNYAKTYSLNYSERTLLLACGIAAGIGAAFNAPIAGVLFALEVLVIDITISAFTPLIIAAASGALISKIALGERILLSFKNIEDFSYYNVPFYVVLGILCGLVSVYHARMFVRIESWFSHSHKSAMSKIMYGGIGLAVLIFFFPSLFGEGFQSIMDLAQEQPNKILDQSYFHDFPLNEWTVTIIVGILIFVKAIATGLTIGGGGNGGNFAPSLFVGAYLGFFFSKMMELLHIANLPSNNFTVVGMAGILSGLYHAPLTAIFLIAEITGGYALMIPLMIVSSIAFGISRYFEPFSFDTKKMAEIGKIFTSDREQNLLVSIKTSRMVESDVVTIGPEMQLGQIVQLLAKCKENVFPVVTDRKILLGLLYLDDLREVMFKPELYHEIDAKQLMKNAADVVFVTDSMSKVMELFDETNLWVLPVVDESGKFVGMISKSNVFNTYRDKLKDNRID